jgi:hypothetical protein
MTEPLIALVAVLCVVVLITQRGLLTPLALSTAQLGLICIGYIKLDELEGGNLSVLYLSGVGLFACGYVIVANTCSNPSRNRSYPNQARMRCSQLCCLRRGSEIRLLAGCVMALTLYHFAAGGIPLLSSELETTRFNFTASGMFGVPGRMFLYGLPFAVILVSVARQRKMASISGFYLVFTWVFYLGASVAAGFKGGIANCVFLYILVQAISGQTLSLRRFLLSWRVSLLALSAGSAITVGMLYQTSQGVGVWEFANNHLWRRVTIGSAEAGHAAITGFGVDGQAGEYLMGDCAYFLRTYFPFAPIALDRGLPLDKLVSSHFYHTPVSSSAFIVPVTVGAFAELSVNFGREGALLGMLLIGTSMAFILRKAQIAETPIHCGIYSFILYMLQVYVTNGNLVYTTLNTVIITVFLFAVYSLGSVFIAPKRRSDDIREASKSSNRQVTVSLEDTKEALCDLH